MNKLKIIWKIIIGVRRSNIKLISGTSNNLYESYEHLVGKENILITSVSISKQVPGYDKSEKYYIMAISYDYYD